MATTDEQLISEIVEQVLRRIASSSDPVQRAVVKPPIGGCTGDYSKFAELRERMKHGDGAGLEPAPTKTTAPIPAPSAGPPPAYIAALSGSASPTPSAAPPSASAAAPPPTVAKRVLSGFVTAEKLIGAARDGVVNLATDARLTPLAIDTAKEKRIRVERVGQAGSTDASTPATPDRWLWWIDGHCDVFNALTQQHAPRTVVTSHPRKQDALHDVVRDLAQRVRRGDMAGGVLFVPSASNAICFANRCATLRAIVGTCDGAVEQGIDQLSANVLVIEYPFQGPQAASAMVDRFINSPRRPLPAIDQQLKELSTCA